MSLLFKRGWGAFGPLEADDPERPPSNGQLGGPGNLRGGALVVPAVWACVRLRASLISSLPLDVFRRTSDGSSQEVPKTPVFFQPSADFSIDEWMFASQVSLDLRGNAYGLVTELDGRGKPAAVELQHPDTVSCFLRDGRKQYRISGKEVDPALVWHERAFTFPGMVTGLDPISYAARTLSVAGAAEAFGAEWFGNAAMPAASLRNEAKTITSDEADRVKKRYRASVRNGDPFVHGKDWALNPIQITAEQTQFLESQRWGVQQIARLFGVPPELIGSESGASMTYANVEQRSLDFLTMHLGPAIARREAALSAWTPKPQYVKFNLGSLLRTDLLTRYRSYEIGIRNKFMTQDEARELEERPPLTPDQYDQLDTLTVSPAPAGAPAEGQQTP